MTNEELNIRAHAAAKSIGQYFKINKSCILGNHDDIAGIIFDNCFGDMKIESKSKLTPVDIEAIVTIADDVLNEISRKELITMGKDWYYQTVLDRYEESKRKANKG